MTTVNARIVNIMDRLAHTSTTDQDILQTVYGLRRMVKGEMPSVLLCFSGPMTMLAQVGNLKKTVSELTCKIQEQDSELEMLRTTLARIDNETKHKSPRKREQNDDYLYAEVMEIIRDKFGKQNGALTLWADYSAKLHAENPASQLLTVSKLQTWRKAGKYPAWAVQQLLDMPVVDRPIHRWSEADIEFLCRLHLSDVSMTDEMLAAECSKQFGCDIPINSIKSKFNLLRKDGRIPMLRPKH